MNKKASITKLGKPGTWQEISPRSPILSSRAAAWKGIHFEYHQQPAYETPAISLPVHAIEVGLSYQASEVKVNGRVMLFSKGGRKSWSQRICPTHPE